LQTVSLVVQIEVNTSCSNQFTKIKICKIGTVKRQQSQFDDEMTASANQDSLSIITAAVNDQHRRFDSVKHFDTLVFKTTAIVGY